MHKIRLGVLFGGRSPEHEISLLSARSILQALDPNRYEVTLIGIDKHGHWHLCNAAHYLLHGQDTALVTMQDPISLVRRAGKADLIRLTDPSTSLPLDVVFPVLHGPDGEDGTVQGFLRLLDLPFVGADVLGSAIGMDKDVMKRLLRDAGIPTAKFLVLTRDQQNTVSFEGAKDVLSCPLFVKPANLGSSVGISKVRSAQEWDIALAKAFAYDHKILLEQAISGREIECAVIGNERPTASLPGELIPQHDFYSYEAKYLDDGGALFIIPAQLDNTLVERIQRMALDAYRVLCCEGMARVDFFLQPNGALLLNEINTIPGFTTISMYPKLWEVSGVPYNTLVDQLVDLAISRFERKQRLKTHFG